MALLHSLLKHRHNAATAIASTSFLVLILISSVHLSATRRNNAVGARASSPAIAAAPSSPRLDNHDDKPPATTTCDAAELRSLPDNAARCRYLSSPPGSHPPCARPRGYIDYLILFYCNFGDAPWLGAAALALWLLVLFYLLGDTASTYFCASLEGLSSALRLPPSIAGVTLLSLGNGAPDVLSSIVAFAAGGSGDEDDDGDAGDVGLSSVLGGALFVSTVVAGVVAIVAAGRNGGDVTIERRGFVRDVCFLLVAVCYLVVVLLAGEVTVWTAASFLSLYVAYVLLVWFYHSCAAAGEEDDDDEDDLLPEDYTKSKPADLTAPLLLAAAGNGDAAPPLPISSKPAAASPPRKTLSRRAMDALSSPLYLPRRLTIPYISSHRWSKPYAVASAFLAPVLLAAIISSPTNPVFLLSGAVLGALLAAAASHSTSSSSPPTNRWAKLPWLAGGFVMSILWSYLLARELVALLVSIGLVAGVRGSVLGATVLAWGNSLGDLVADVALAARGGGGGAQTAVAGCYAGPAFNVVVGLGLSLTVAAAARYPRVYVVAVDSPAYEAAGFLAAALVVLPARRMRLDRLFGVGLLVVYLGFLAVRLGSLAGAFGGGGGS